MESPGGSGSPPGGENLEGSWGEGTVQAGPGGRCCEEVIVVEAGS